MVGGRDRGFGAARGRSARGAGEGFEGGGDEPRLANGGAKIARGFWGLERIGGEIGSLLKEFDGGQEERFETGDVGRDIEGVGAAGRAVDGGEVDVGGGLDVGLIDPDGEREEGVLGRVGRGGIAEGMEVEAEFDGGLDEGAVCGVDIW